MSKPIQRPGKGVKPLPRRVVEECKIAAVVETPDAGIAKHREYSLTWFSLAATLAALWVGLNLKRARP